jgi:hypothetical protein
MSRQTMHRASTFVAVLALLLGQVGAQLHDLDHLKHDLALAGHAGKKAPPLGHSAEVCVGYAAICSAIGHASPWALLPPGPPDAVPVSFRFFLPRAPRVHFLTRAPPGLLLS